MSEKTQAELLKEELYFTKKNAYEIMSKEETEQCYSYCEDYKKFLDVCKTGWCGCSAQWCASRSAAARTGG